MVAAICALNIGINMMLDNEIKKSEALQRNINLYDRLIVKKDTDFEYYVTRVYNPQLKAKTYRSKINHEIYLLNRFSRKKDRLLYSSELPEMQAKKKKNRYCIKRAQLEELKSDAYIEKNLDSIAVKYYEVDPAVFELEINGAQKSNGVKVTGNITLGRARESSTIIMSMLLISMMTTSFGLAVSKEEFENNVIAFWHYCLKAVEDVGVVLWQFFNGTIRTRKIVSKELTQPYAGRNEVLQAYINWRVENKAKESHVAKELKADDGVLEVSEDEYKEILEKQKEPI
jgi:hypothetical protein